MQCQEDKSESEVNVKDDEANKSSLKLETLCFLKQRKILIPLKIYFDCCFMNFELKSYCML